MKKIYFLTFIMTGAVLINKGFAQGHLSKEACSKIVSEIIKKKLRYNIFENPEIRKRLPLHELQVAERLIHQDGLQSTEAIVSNSAEIESEIHAAINPTNNNNMVCSANTIDPGSTGANDVPMNHIYYTTDFGATWTLSTFDPLPVTSGNLIAGGGDPNFAFDKTGRVYTSWINLYVDAGFSTIDWQMLWAYSDDGGIIWSRGTTAAISQTSGPLFALFDPTLFNGPISDKEWLAVDRSDSAYQNNLYCVFYEVGGPANVNAIAVRKKDAGSNSFSAVSVYVTDNTFLFVQFSSIDVDNTGDVHVAFFGSTDSINYSLYHSVSTDGGNTFSTPNVISAVQEFNYSPGQTGLTIPGIDVQRMYPGAYIAADRTNGLPSSGNLYMTWTANGVTSQGTNGADVFFSKSTDGGVTWSGAVPMNNTSSSDASDQYYSCIDVNPNGVVVVCWYDRRNYPSTETTDYYMAYSIDGGVTFNNDTVVSNAPTDFNTVGSQNSNFGIGEYNAVVTTADYAIPFWSDGRSNNGDMDIYSATVPLNPNVGTGQLSQVNATVLMSNLFPNPTSGRVHVHLAAAKKSNTHLSVYDKNGKWVKDLFNGVIEGERTIDMDLSTFAPGNYSVVLRSETGIAVRSFEKIN